jgi:hypothetical protein
MRAFVRGYSEAINQIRDRNFYTLDSTLSLTSHDTTSKKTINKYIDSYLNWITVFTPAGAAGAQLTQAHVPQRRVTVELAVTVS